MIHARQILRLQEDLNGIHLCLKVKHCAPLLYTKEDFLHTLRINSILSFDRDLINLINAIRVNRRYFLGR